MAVDDASFLQSYEVVSSKIASSTQMSNRTEAILNSLKQETDGSSKPAIVCMTAPAKATGKLISIVEIVKREMAAKGSKCYQYNVLSSEMAEIPRLPQAKGRPRSDDAPADEEETFETMGTDVSTKKRNIPTMTVYLSTSPVKELRAQYGEQR